jgi:hypothetical protein
MDDKQKDRPTRPVSRVEVARVRELGPGLSPVQHSPRLQHGRPATTLCTLTTRTPHTCLHILRVQHKHGSQES